MTIETIVSSKLDIWVLALGLSMLHSPAHSRIVSSGMWQTAILNNLILVGELSPKCNDSQDYNIIEFGIFNLSSGLRCHMFTHTGDAPNVCPHCRKAFRDLSSLKRHNLTHTCTEKAQVQKHALSHTGEEPQTNKDGEHLLKAQSPGHGQKKFQSVSNLEQDKKTLSEEVMSKRVVNNTLSKDSSERTSQSVNTSCSDCIKGFLTLADLLCHINLIHGS